MQEFSSNSYSGIIETHVALISDAGSVARRLSLYVGNRLGHLLGRMHKATSLSPATVRASRREVAIKYFGRGSEWMRMTMVIPDGRYTLGQLMCSLYKRGDAWVDRLDDSELACTVNGRDAKLFDTIEPGAEIRIALRKSTFEAPARRG